MKPNKITNPFVMFPLAAMILAPYADAALTIQGSGFYEEGNTGGISDITLPISINSANSVFVVGVYIDAGAPVSMTATFNGNAPDATLLDLRTISFVFHNPSMGSGNLFLDPTTTDVTLPGIGVIYYEVGGADLATINSVTASNTITTNTADELVISFAGRNGTTVPTVDSGSIFTSGDFLADTMKGSGSLASANATVPVPGSNNITWNNAAEGRIAYSFDAVPEPGSIMLGGIGLMCLIRRRR